MTVTSLHGDNTLIIPTLAPRSVQCTVTSPPYYGLRDYGLPPTEWPEVTYAPMAGLEPITIPAMACCFGLEPTPAAYIGHLVYTWRLLAPVLRDDGTCWLNLGDSYANWGAKMERNTGESGRHKLGVSGNSLGRVPNMKHKDLLGIPWRAAFALQADGWYLRSDIIWAKPNPMPESVTDRPTKAHEYMFLLAKSERYYYDVAAVAEPAVRAGDVPGGGGGYVSHISGGHNKDGLSVNAQKPVNATRNRRTVWNVATQPYSGAHFAVMPEALIEPCILAGSSAKACEHCGAAWVRVVEKGMPSADSDRPQQRRAAELWVEKGLTDAHLVALRAVGMADAGKAQHTMTGYGKNAPEVQRLADEAKAALGGYLREFLTGSSLTAGFAPACACPDNTGSAASVVLDPFGGSGTVGKVATRLQRNAVLIDLNPDYIALQAERTDKVQVEMFV